MLSTERRRHDVHMLFGDVSYDARKAHWRVNNKIKGKFTYTIKSFISCNENIQIFTRASHSWKYWCFYYTRWQYLWYSQPKSKYPLFILELLLVGSSWGLELYFCCKSCLLFHYAFSTALYAASFLRCFIMCYRDAFDAAIVVDCFIIWFGTVFIIQLLLFVSLWNFRSSFIFHACTFYHNSRFIAKPS